MKPLFPSEYSEFHVKLAEKVLLLQRECSFGFTCYLEIIKHPFYLILVVPGFLNGKNARGKPFNFDQVFKVQVVHFFPLTKYNYVQLKITVIV